ncbi:aldehyde dehydrogenase family protein [Salipiger sp. P9]|uniref:aldehyde dehydrogenase family protein n=1 Tax=Salipiger pentaromativorans TaxID=2943193 RepID=UPI0021572505|nr:aldehyde dehydrogenase family protein [Salipiger pentaromativorans]MCR8546896.1 aldehyde dehydrogenase family protein [Salipiger pentaromativorans]
MPTSYRSPSLYLAGRWQADTAATAPVVDPATGREIGRVPLADAALVAEALDAAERAFAPWRALGAEARGAILERAAGLLRGGLEEAARHIVLEQGKPLAEARLEIASCAGMLEWFAAAGRAAPDRPLPAQPGFPRRIIRQEPIGPVAAFAPWNFPASIPTRKAAAALAAGCPVVVKPAEETPAGFGFVARALHEAGLPPGVLSVLYGDPGPLSAQVIASPAIRKIAFTGSTRVGCLIGEMAGRLAKPCVLELGGHSPVLVLEDADIEMAVARSVQAKFRNGGQICGSPTRFYIHESRYDAFADRFAEAVARLPMGSGLDPETRLGPMIGAGRVEALHALVTEAVAQGATLRSGGELPNGPGFFYRPTLLQDVPETARIMQEEPFGPVVVLNRFSDREDALARANGTPYALAAYAFAGSGAGLDWAGAGLDAGLVGLNSYAVVFADTPISGRRSSGYGSEGGAEGLREYLIPKFLVEEG